MSSNLRRKRLSKRDTWITVGLGVLIAVLVAWLRQLPSGDTIAVVFSSNRGSSPTTFHLAVADESGERTKGVMYMKPGDIPEDGGMLFVYPKEEPRGHWMRNTYISLDMLFVNQERKIVGIISRVPILNDEPRRVETPSTYVVELLAGMAEKYDIRVGDEMKFLAPTPRAIS